MKLFIIIFGLVFANPLFGENNAAKVSNLMIIAQNPDASEEIKSNIILALEEIGGVEALNALKKMAIDHEGQTISNRALAIQAIGKITRPEAIEFFNQILASEHDSIIQFYTLRALNEIGDYKSKDPLIEYIQQTQKNYLAYVPKQISNEKNRIFYAENLKLLFTALQVLNKLDKNESLRILNGWATIQIPEGTDIKAKAQNALKQQAVLYLKN